MLETKNSEVDHSGNTPLNVGRLVDYLATQPDVVAAYLFGSHATGKARPQSDVDVAVLLSQTDGFERFERRLRLMRDVEEAIGRRADVVILNDAPPLLTHRVLKEGNLIFEHDQAARVEFEVRVGQVYTDLAPMRHFFREALFREIQGRGLGGQQ